MLEQFLIAAAASATSSFFLVYFARVVLMRFKSWPKSVPWVLRMAISLSIFVFIIVVRTNTRMNDELVKANLVPLAKGVAVGAAFMFLYTIIRIGKVYLWKVFDISGHNNLGNRMRQTQLQFVEKLLILALVVISGGSILLSFEAVRELGTSILASAGVAGLVIGFASQKIVANLLAGFQIAFSQPIRFDDAVVIDGEWGWIEEITLTYVVVRLWDLRRMIVPLSRLLEQPFQNWTRRDSKMIGTVFLYTSYDVNLEEIRSEVRKVLTSTPLWDGDVMSVQVTDSKPQTMEVRILATARNSPQAFDLRCLIRERLIAFLSAKSPPQIGEVRLDIRQPAT